MSENNVESNASNKQSIAPTTADQHAGGRRSFLKKTAISLPLVATLSSRNVWALGNNCSLTGTLSGNASAHNIDLQEWCAGQMGALSPDEWADMASWPGSVLDESTTFFEVFFEMPVGGDSTTTVRQIINDKMNMVFEPVEREVVAAYLNRQEDLYSGLSLSLGQIVGGYSAALLDGSRDVLLTTLLQIRNA